MTTHCFFDLDSCLIDDDHRKHLINWEKLEFDAYHDASDGDKVLPLGAAMLKAARNSACQIIISTVRPLRRKEATQKQLLDLFNLRPHEYCMFMRKDGENAPSQEIKIQAFRNYCDSMVEVENGDEVYAFDDHPKVVQAYQREGAKAWLLSRTRLIQGECDRVLEAIHRGEDFEMLGAYHAAIDPLMYRPVDSILIGSWVQGFVFFPFCGNFSSIQHPLIASVIGGMDGLRRDNIRLSEYPENNVHTAETSAMAAAAKKEKGIEGNDTGQETFEDVNSDQFNELDTLELIRNQSPTGRIAADVLEEAAKTFRERNAVYKDNANVVGKVMLALFPNGVKLETPEDFHMWHLFELLIVKLTRFTNSGLTHQDSILDLTVYAAMLEPLINSHTIKIK